jgi:hypothetical protein
MTVKRLRHLAATLAVIVFVPGGGSAALAETETVDEHGSATAEPDTTARAVQHQRRVEASWLGEQLRAGARARASPPVYDRPRGTAPRARGGAGDPRGDR